MFLLWPSVRAPKRARRWRGPGVLAAAAALAGCAGMADAPRLHYLCPHALRFDARLYEDMAYLEGMRGHVLLSRVPAPEGAPDDSATPRYADETVHASFGLGQGGRLARLDYASIPTPLHCELAPTPGGEAAPSTRAQPRPGPRNPPPFDPDAPVQVNWRSSGGEDSAGEGNLRPAP